MKKLALLTLAAGAALVPAAALAQHHGGGHGMRGGGNVTVGHHGGGMMHHRGNFGHQRLQRGFFIHPFFFGPQFHVQNWQLYGFAAPPPQHRWVRHYDDAYLVDREGRVRDHRYGLDWDQYGERWEMADGIPSYYGRGDYRPDDEDYAWVERHGGRDRGGYDYEEGYADRGGYGYGPPPGPACPSTPHPCAGHGGYGAGYGAYGAGYGAYGGGYGYGYGYGWGYAYPIIIETTVHTAGASYVEEVTEEVIEETYHRPRRQYRARSAPPPRARPQQPRPRPRPPAGERG